MRLGFIFCYSLGGTSCGGDASRRLEFVNLWYHQRNYEFVVSLEGGREGRGGEGSPPSHFGDIFF